MTTNNIITRNWATLEAIRDGKRGQIELPGSGWRDASPDEIIEAMSRRYEVRPKPEPQWVAWDDETRPKGPIVLESKSGGLVTVFRYDIQWTYYCDRDEKWTGCNDTDDDLLENYLWHHSDGTITPCGTEVSP